MIFGSTYRLFSTLLLGACISLTGCEKAIFVELPTHDPQLVVTGFFSPDSLWQVEVSSSVSYTSLQEPRHIDNATVEIRVGTQLVEYLDAIGGGRYISSTNKPEAGRLYILRVRANNYVSIEARNEVPETIGDAGLNIAGSSEPTFYGSIKVPLELTFEDPETFGNYYGLVVHNRRIWQFDGGETHTEIWQIGYLSEDLALREDNVFDIEEEWYQDAFFNDDVFNGRQYTLEFNVELFDMNPAPPSLIDSIVDVYLFSVSEDYYLHEKTVHLQEDVGDNPFSEPVQIHSNVSNGYGIFAGYRVRKFEISVGPVR